jgi:outer membrane protein
MKRRLAAVAVAIAFGGALPTGASALDLLQALQAAAAIDPVVASSRAQVAATMQRVPQARAALGPQVNATASANLQLQDTNRGPQADYNAQQLGIAASLPLYRPAFREALRQAELGSEASELQLAQARQDLILRVAQAYFDVLAAQDSLAAIRTQKRAIGEQFAAARRAFEVGTATVTDQQEAQSRLDLATAQEVAVMNDLEVRRAALTQLIGRPVDEMNTLRPGAEVGAPVAANEGEWASIARQQNLTVRQAELGAEIARREIDRQRFANNPTVDAVSTLGATRSTAPATGLRGTSALVGVQLSMPLFEGGAITARTREAIALQERSHFDLENARRVAEQAARQTFLGVRSGVEQVRALEAAERSSQLALESNQLGYEVGVRISIDVLNAVQQLTVTQRDLARARYDVLVNGLRLRNTAGSLTETDIVAVNALLGPPPPPPPAPPAARQPQPSAAPKPPAAAPAAPTPKPPAAAPARRAPSPAPATPGTRGGRSATPTAPR